MNMNYEEAKRLMKTARDKDKGKPLDKANTRLYEVNDSAHLYPVYEIRLHGHPIIRMINTETSYVFLVSLNPHHVLGGKYEFIDGMEIAEPRTNLGIYHVYVNRKQVEAVRNDWPYT